MDKEAVLLDSGLFEVDEMGSVWRIARRAGTERRGGTRVWPCPRHRAEYLTRSGYLLVCATIKGTKVATGAHRLAWTHANGPIPEGLTINHRNGIKTDNRPQNLETATSSEQRRHALDVLNVRRHRPTGAKHPKTKLVDADVLEMRLLRANGQRVKDIAAAYDMNPKAVSAICRRRTWTHI